MPDEETFKDEETQDEKPTEETEEEVSESESEETPEEEKPETEKAPEDDVEAEYYEESEYLKRARERGLEGEYNTLDELVEAAIESSKKKSGDPQDREKLERVRQKLRELNFHGDIDGFLDFTPQPTYQPPGGQGAQQYQLPTYTAALQAAVQSGDIDPDTASQFTGYAKVQDTVLNQLYMGMAQMYQMVEGLRSTTGTTVKSLRDQEWDSFKGRNQAVYQDALFKDRHAIDAYRGEHNYKTYDQTVRAMIADDPDRFNSMLKHIGKKAEEKVERKNRQIKILRSKKGGQRDAGVSWRDYTTSEGGINEGKLMRDLQTKKITKEQYDKICDEVISRLEKSDRG